MYFYVYEHWRPDRSECFYVGKGKHYRANELTRGRSRYHRRVTQSLHELGMSVDVRIVASGLSEKDAFALEINRIAYWRSAGIPLANATSGGEGCAGISHSEATRAKISASLTGKKLSQETVAKLVAIRSAPEYRERSRIAQLGKKSSPETVAKIAAAHTGAKRSPEARASMTAAQFKRFESSEERRKISEGRKGIIFSHEHREKMSAARRGKPGPRLGMTFTEQAKAKISAALKGRARTPEAIAKQRATCAAKRNERGGSLKGVQGG